MSCIWGNYVTCVRLVLIPYFWLNALEGEEHRWLVSCILERYGVLHEVRYSHPAFSYILWKVRNIMGWWVASEEGMVPYIRLVTLPLLLFTFCGRWEVPWVRWVASEEGMVPYIRLVTLPLLLVTFCGRWGTSWVGDLHLRKVWCPT